VLSVVQGEEFEFEEGEVSVAVSLSLEEFDVVVGAFERPG
jgi:hypothetical protein